MTSDHPVVRALISTDPAVWNEQIGLPYGHVEFDRTTPTSGRGARGYPLGECYLLHIALEGDAHLSCAEPSPQSQSVPGLGVSVPVHGAAEVTSRGERAECTPSELCLIPGGMAFDLRMTDDYDAYWFLAPGQSVDPIVGPRVPFAHPTAIPREGIAAALADHITSLLDHADDLPIAHGKHVSRSVISLISAAFAGLPLRETPDALRAAQRRRVKVTALEHLADPDLDARSLAEANGISLRYLHGLFEDTDETVMAWVRARRLERCREALASPRQAHLSIGEIGYRWGFNSPSHFSRAFRRHFGITPSAVRAGKAPRSHGRTQSEPSS